MARRIGWEYVFDKTSKDEWSERDRRSEVLGVFGKVFQVRGLYLTLKLRTPLELTLLKLRLYTIQLSTAILEKLSSLMKTVMSDEVVGVLVLGPFVLFSSKFFQRFHSVLPGQSCTSATKCNTNRMAQLVFSSLSNTPMYLFGTQFRGYFNLQFWPDSIWRGFIFAI